MLSRTADHLCWMSRYIERAESLARLVDAHYRMSMLPQSGDTLTAVAEGDDEGLCTCSRPTARSTRPSTRAPCSSS